MMPGPGHFNNVDDWAPGSKGTGFGTSKRGNINNTKDGSLPGPGNYSLTDKSLNAAPAYSMGYKK